MSIPLRQIERSSASDAVRDQLLALVQSGRLPPGAKLPSEHELARRFGVSRPVVREGLGALRAAGVVESRPGAGSFVRAARPSTALLLLSRYSPEHLHEVRCHVEVPGAGLAALRRTDEHLRCLTEIVRRHAGCTRVEQWVRDDLSFHVTLAEATGNELQARLVRDLGELQYEQSALMARITGELGAPEEEHVAIVEAVRRRDGGAAREAMTAHLSAIKARRQDAEREHELAEGDAA